MRHGPHALLQPQLTLLRELPFVDAVNVRPAPARAGRTGAPDALLRVRAGHTTHELLVAIKRTNLTQTLADTVLAMAATTPRKRWLLLAPFIAPHVAEKLAEHGLNYMDAAGNCRIALGKDHLAWVAGRKPERKPVEGRGIGAPGYRVMFALLANPDMLTRPVRLLAADAGVGKTAAADMLRRLEGEGHVARGRGTRRLVEPRALMEQWLAGYERVLRPRLLVGRFRAADRDPRALERRLEGLLARDPDWAWGGGAAAMRLTKHYRGALTILHHAAPPADLPRRLGLLPAAGGDVLVLQAPSRVGLHGPRPRTAHPLLIHAELLLERGERAREAAEDIRRRYLER